MAMTEAEYLAKASDPTTTSEQLEVLWVQANLDYASLQASGLRRAHGAIARNPNLPPMRMRECFGELAHDLASNPALPLFVLENQQPAETTAKETLLRLLKRIDAPAIIVEILMRHSARQISDTARLHITLYGEANEQQVFDELRALPAGGKNRLAKLHSWNKVPLWLAKRHKLATFKEPLLPPQVDGAVNDEPLTEAEREELEDLMEKRTPKGDSWHRRQGRREWWAAQPNQKAEALRHLVQEAGARYFVINNAAIPADLLHWCADEQILNRRDAPLDLKWEATLREMGAMSPSGLVAVLWVAHLTSLDALHEEALSPRWIRRLGAALNPWLTDGDRKRLSGDANAIVRAVGQDIKLRDRIMDYGCDGAV